MKKTLFAACAVIFFLALSVSAQLNLQENATLNGFGFDPDRVYQRFSFNNATRRIGQIEGYLRSFAILMENYKDRFTEEELNSIGNTAWDIQNLGFNNNLKAVEGALHKQEYLLKQLEYELAQYKHTAGEITDEELTGKREAFSQAEKSFQSFWDALKLFD
ncbi:hypothetical protein ACFL6K_02815 [Candidatus Latescibacterota bacterium]